MVPAFYAVEESDRIFLANLDVREAATREQVAEADRASATRVQGSQPVPVAVAVAMPPSAPEAPPIPRATLVRAAAPVTPATSAPEATLAFGGTSLTRNETTPASTEPEVRRAIPVARAIPAPVASNRASTGPYQGEIFTFSSVREQVATGSR